MQYVSLYKDSANSSTKRDMWNPPTGENLIFRQLHFPYRHILVPRNMIREETGVAALIKVKE